MTVHTDVTAVLMSHFEEILGKRESDYIGFVTVDNIFFGCLCGKPFLSIGVMHSVIMIGAKMPVWPLSELSANDTRLVIPKHFHRRGVRRTAMLNGVKKSLAFGNTVAAQKLQTGRKSFHIIQSTFDDSYAIIELYRPDSVYQVDYMANRIITKVAKSIKVCRGEIYARFDTVIHLMKYAMDEWLKKRDAITPK